MKIKACTCVCRDFVDICYHHIFYEISLSHSAQLPFTISPVRRYKKIFEKSPRIVNNICSVKYINEIGLNDPISVLHWLHQVHTFSFGFRNVDRYNAKNKNWHKISPQLRQSFCHFIRSNNIVNLHLRSIWDVPAEIFMHFPYLEDLELVNITVSQRSPSWAELHSLASNSRFRNLAINDSLGAITTLTRTTCTTGRGPLINLQSLEKFYFSNNYSITIMAAIGQILTLSDCLTSVEIRGKYISRYGLVPLINVLIV